MPDLAAYAKALPDNVQLITICIDALDDLEGTQAYAHRLSQNFPGFPAGRANGHAHHRRRQQPATRA